MAAIVRQGYELNSTTANVEFGAINGAPTISSTVSKDGTYSGRISSLSSGTPKDFRRPYAVAGAGPTVSFLRTYFRVDTLPSAENRIFTGRDGNLAADRIWMTIDNGGLLRLYDEDGQVGSASSALSTATFYCLELKLDRTAAAGSHVVEGRIDTSVFATASNRNVSTPADTIRVGGNLNSEAQTTGDWYFDDLAVNDATGSFQTGYPGTSRLIILRPNGAGDSHTFATQTGGTAGAANNYTRVDETTPNDATDFNGSNTLNQEDLFAFDNSGLGANDIINCVQVNMRFRNNTADATTAIKAEIMKTTGGTKTQSSAIVVNSTTWFSNDPTLPRLPVLTLYTDPDGNPWTQTTLDTLQAGYIISTGGVNRIEVTNMWIYVDYTLVTTIVKDIIGGGVIPFAR